MTNKKIVEFKGIVVANPWNSENYKVYGLSVDINKYPDIKLNKYSNVSVTGNLPNLEEGIEYSVKAIESKGKHGYEYKFLNIRRDIPKTIESTKLFLMQVLESEQQVNEIIREYPDIIDRVINNNLQDIDLGKLYNIGEYRFNVIKRRILENFALAELVEEFKGILDFKILKTLFDKYGSVDKIKEELQEEPYKCLCGLSRIAFKSADNILLELDKECKNMIKRGENPPINFKGDLLTSQQRQKAAIMFLLKENESNGNTKMDIKKMKKQCESLANKCMNHFASVIKNDKDIYFDRESLTVALTETYNTELYIANRIIEGLKINNKWNIKEKDYSKIDDIILTEEQVRTIPMICENNISILTAPAGAGKSQSIKAIINMLKDNNKSFSIFSPTGRAAKVISEFTNEATSTIHKGLGYMPPVWHCNEENPLCCNIVIVDESSMIDIFLMKRLIEAIDFNKTKLLFIGDVDQIPSVGAGNIFYDLIYSNVIPVNRLSKIFRYGEGGQLTVATKTRKCEKFLDYKKEIQFFGKDKGYIFIKTTQEKMINKLLALYKKLLNSGHKTEDIMILSAYNKGEYGTVNINKNLQPIANKNAKLNNNHMIIGDIKFYEEDLIIQTVNNYKARLYIEDEFAEYNDDENKIFIPNGEIGKIIEIRYNTVIVQFSNDKVIYTREDMNNVKLAYSISIHKSQGGQAPIIILLTPKAHTYMLNSNLIYVGQTRAKEKVYHFGSVETVNRAIKKKADFNRKTYLKDLLLGNN